MNLIYTGSIFEYLGLFSFTWQFNGIKLISSAKNTLLVAKPENPLKIHYNIPRNIMIFNGKNARQSFKLSGLILDLISHFDIKLVT